ncbi:MAG: hypothetical protein ACE5I7_05545 [Candidatus Binatia bacterium]
MAVKLAVGVSVGVAVVVNVAVAVGVRVAVGVAVGVSVRVGVKTMHRPELPSHTALGTTWQLPQLGGIPGGGATHASAPELH